MAKRSSYALASRARCVGGRAARADLRDLTAFRRVNLKEIGGRCRGKECLYSMQTAGIEGCRGGIMIKAKREDWEENEQRGY